MSSKIVIVGGSDAGVSAALRITELDRQADVTLIVADNYPGFSICGLPFFLSGEVADWRSLAHHNEEEFRSRGIRLLLNHRAEAILPREKRVNVASPRGPVQEITYDKLLVATGAESARPPLPGLEQRGVFLLRYMDDGLALQHFLEEQKPRRCVVVGGGYIGLEMADALTGRGLEVTVLEFAPEILTAMDPEMGALIRREMGSRGVRVVVGQAVKNIESRAGKLAVRMASGGSEETEMVLVAAGVRPNTRLAQNAGVALGTGNAIHVERSMATNVPDLWAAGDCTETWHHLLRSNVYMPLGSTAHKQGRIAGENLLGGSCEFQGTLGTQAVKVFGRVAAATGLRNAQAGKAGFNPFTAAIDSLDHNPYYANSQEMHVAITGDRGTGLLLGGQIVGQYSSEVSKRIDIIAAAIFSNKPVMDLIDLDLSYTPPLSTPWDPVQKAAMHWLAQAGQAS